MSPLGETNEVDGFWDGGRTWRVRFSPDQPGRWKFRTPCSDKTNDGLHNEFGEFICTAATGLNVSPGTGGCVWRSTSGIWKRPRHTFLLAGGHGLEWRARSRTQGLGILRWHSGVAEVHGDSMGGCPRR